MDWKNILKNKLPEGDNIAEQIASGSESYAVGQSFSNPNTQGLKLSEGSFMPKTHEGNIQVWSKGDMDLHISLVDKQPRLTKILQGGQIVWGG
jgi:hypothetical protein